MSAAIPCGCKDTCARITGSACARVIVITVRINCAASSDTARLKVTDAIYATTNCAGVTVIALSVRLTTTWLIHKEAEATFTAPLKGAGVPVITVLVYRTTNRDGAVDTGAINTVVHRTICLISAILISGATSGE